MQIVIPGISTESALPKRRALTFSPVISRKRLRCPQHRSLPRPSKSIDFSLSRHLTRSQSESYQEVEPILLDEPASPAKLDNSCHQISQHLELWLNEEWSPLPIHSDLARAAAQAYKKVRLNGEHEMGGVLLGVSSELMAFDYKETFVNAFEVANKLAEVVMMMDRREVCCQSEEDREQYEHVASKFAEE